MMQEESYEAKVLKKKEVLDNSEVKYLLPIKDKKGVVVRTEMTQIGESLI